MTYLLLGSDEISKQRKIENIKLQVLKGNRDFNYNLFYADELTLKTFKEALYRYPLSSLKRVVVVKNLEKANLQIKQFLLPYLKKEVPSTILILETEEFNPRDDFWVKLSKNVTIFRFSRPKFLNTFDLAQSIMNKNPDLSLRILSGLLSRGEKETKILGGLIWYWRKNKEDIPYQRLTRDLSLLSDTELNIKTGKITPSLALELLVLKLSS